MYGKQGIYRQNPSNIGTARTQGSEKEGKKARTWMDRGKDAQAISETRDPYEAERRRLAGGETRNRASAWRSQSRVTKKFRFSRKSNVFTRVCMRKTCGPEPIGPPIITRSMLLLSRDNIILSTSFFTYV